MDKNKRLLEFPLMDEFAVDLKMNLQMPEPFNQFKLLFPQKRTAELHQATLTNLNALVEPDIYVPIGLNINMARLMLVSDQARPNLDDLTPEEEDLLEVPRRKRSVDDGRKEPVRFHPNPMSMPASNSLSSGNISQGVNGSLKRGFEEFSDFMDGLDQDFRRPQDILDSLKTKLRDIFVKNTTQHNHIALSEIARKIPDAQVTASIPVTLPSVNFFPSEKVIQSTANLISKTSHIDPPDLSLITVGEDNHKVLSFFRKSGDLNVFEKTREFGIYVPSEVQRRATGSATNLFFLDSVGMCAVVPIDFSVDIRKENRDFVKNARTLVGTTLVPLDETRPEAEQAEQSEPKEDEIAEGEQSDVERKAMNAESKSATSEDSLDRMVLE